MIRGRKPTRQDGVREREKWATQPSSGFSLVEVVMAVAIATTVLLSLAALIPLALTKQRDANSRTTEARIVQTLVGELQLCDWDEIDNRYSTATQRTRHFDDQGSVLASAGDHIYTARVYLLPGHLSGGASLSSTDLPGDQALLTDRSEHLRRVLIRVTSVPGNQGETLLDVTPLDDRVRRFTANVVNLRKR